MILPGSPAAVLILLILGMLCWGLWANTYKAVGEKWRFELYYFDFAIGVLLTGALVAMTLGSLGFDGFSFADDLQLAGKRQDAFGFVGGMIFNLGNMLLLGAVSVSGMAVAFPMAMGMALVFGTFWTYILNPGGNPVLLFIGVAVVFASVVVAILAFRIQATAQRMASVQQGKAKSTKKKISSKAVILSLFGGLLIGSSPPLIQMARAGENGLGPYSVGFIFAIGIFFSTFVFNLFFMNLPIQGEPIDLGVYFKAKMKRHAAGFASGIVWYVGLAGGLVGSRIDGAAKAPPSFIYVMGQAGTFIAALCGILIWKEFEGADPRAKTYLVLMLVLLAIGIGLASTGSFIPPNS